jgi:outer membrane murein-binding lipoprotein Lpp
MKKVTFLLAALIIGGMMLTGCRKDNPSAKGYYSYTTVEQTQSSFDDVSALTEILRPKLAHGIYTLTKEEAVAEWNSFLQAIENVNVNITKPDSYYTVKFNRKEEKDGTFVTVETIGEKTWKANE